MSPIGSILQPSQHSYLEVPFEKAEVVDAMRMGVVSCPADTSVRDAARMMATYRIHCVLVAEPNLTGPMSVVSDLDVAAAADGDADRLKVGEVAGTEPLTVAGDEKLIRAAQLMAEHGVSHLVVVAGETGHPVGILSSLDLAEALAWSGGS
jgi:CBS domain-containing protein